MKKLKNLYQQQMFYPNWLGVFINPFYFARSRLNAAVVELAPSLQSDLLDVGCGTKPYEKLFTNVSFKFF